MFKSKEIVIKARHDWGVEGTKERITQRFEVLRKNFLGLVTVRDFGWEGDVGHIQVRALGQTVNAVCDVRPNNLEIKFELPWLVSRFAGPIESFINSHGDVLKSKPPEDGVKPIMKPLPFHQRIFRSKRTLETSAEEAEPAAKTRKASG